MKFGIKNIFCSLAFAALSTVGLTACISDGAEPDCPNGTDSEVDALVVSFRVAVPSAAHSRASVPDNGDSADHWEGYTPGDEIEFENTILPRNFTVTLYDIGDGDAYLGRVTAFTLDRISGAPDGGDYYDFHGILDLADASITEAVLGAITAKLVITANGAPTDAQKLAPLADAGGLGAVTFSKIGQQADVEAIPMWGVATKSLAGISQGKVFDFGEISLLRAMAKVEVNFDRSETSEVKDLKLTEVAINRANAIGYVLPESWNTVDATPSLKLDQTMRIPSQTAIVPRAFTTLTSGGDSDGAIIFYLPEIENAAGADELTLTVKYADGEGTIHFAKYTDGKPSGPLYDILRNHHYRFTITKVPDVAEDITIELDYTVCDWGSGNTDIEFN